jgi:REP element-mobilizing transposase RayT
MRAFLREGDMPADEPLASHVIFCTRGFWLPNDPRGSCSTTVRAANLRPSGRATAADERRSLAAVPHDRALRAAAKRALVLPEVVFDGRQALSVANGFADMVAKAGYVVHACSILPCHVHMVVLRHCYPVDQVVRLLRQAATRRLLADGLHPVAALRTANGRLPSVWAQDFWKVFLYSEQDIREKIAYVEDNPVKEGKRPQRWRFVTPIAPSAPVPV